MALSRETHTELLTLLTALIKLHNETNYVNESLSDSEFEDARGLLHKIIGHSLSVFHLLECDKQIAITNNFTDVSSINVLMRAAIESFLVFYYIYTDSTTTHDELKFRYYAWVYAGLQERIKMSESLPFSTPNIERRIDYEKKLFKEYHDKICSSRYFHELTTKQQKAILKGKWKYKEWSTIGLSAGLDEIHANIIYSYLCGYAHSSNLSIIQIQQAITKEEQDALPIISILLVVISNMVKAWLSLFPMSKGLLSKASLEIIDIYNFLGSSGLVED